MFLEKDPNTPGSLGIAISEAVEAAVSDTTGSTKYSLGSVLNHVLLHQTIIGLEAKKQLAKIGIKKPDVVIACAGGGSNFGGIAFPFVNDKINGAKIEIIPVEPSSCPIHDPRHVRLRLRRQRGHDAAPAHAYAGPQFPALADPRRRPALSRHGAAGQPGASSKGLLPRAPSRSSNATRPRCSGRVPKGSSLRPETSHAVAVTIQEALKAKEEGKEKVILMNLSGHGLMDLLGYQKYLAGELQDYRFRRRKSTKRKRNSASSPNRRQ